MITFISLFFVWVFTMVLDYSASDSVTGFAVIGLFVSALVCAASLIVSIVNVIT